MNFLDAIDDMVIGSDDDVEEEFPRNEPVQQKRRTIDQMIADDENDEPEFDFESDASEGVSFQHFRNSKN